jgi:ribosome biogenesis GTPase A
MNVILINELRNGTLGNITLEHPDMITEELINVAIASERKIEEKIKKKEERRKRYLKNKR